MELVTARKLARTLMDEHGLSAWAFTFDRARRRFGSCSVARRRITLSASLTQLNEEGEVRDTILHEIAHALTPGDGHGERWKAACRKLGAKPERCYRETTGSGVVAPKTGLRIGCKHCDWWVGRHRVTWAIQTCRRCGHQVVWEHVGSGRRYQIARVAGGFHAVAV